jgi:DNA-binding LacI/PurR family transcriptional regulator
LSRFVQQVEQQDLFRVQALIELVFVAKWRHLASARLLQQKRASVRQPSQGLGQLVAQLVINAIEHTEPFRQAMLVPATLVIRDRVVAPNLVT